MKFNITSPQKAGFNSKRLERVNPLMEQRVKEKKIIGLSTMVASHGKIVQFEQFGHMDAVGKKSMSKDAIFRLYSMTKPVICAALMLLYERGLFHLFDPVSQYIPEFSKLTVLTVNPKGQKEEVDAVRPITICDLLKHTSGLTYDFLEDSPVCELYREARLMNDANRSLSEFVSELSRLPLAYQPGSTWHYSVGIDVAAYLIEILSQQSLGDFLRKNLFKPLGMVDTDFFVPKNKLSRLVTMFGRYDISGPGVTMSQLVKARETAATHVLDVSDTYPTSNPNFARGGVGLYSTMQDYMRFAQFQLNGGELDGEKLLSRKTIELMFCNHLPQNLIPITIGGFPFSGYGFGLGSRVLVNVADSQTLGSLGEYGWGGAAKTYYWIDPVEKIIGLFMRQDMMDFDAHEKDFQTLVYQALN